MDYLKSQFDRIQQQLSGLTASQKMLSAALVIIMVMTFWGWGRYASQPEMEALLDQTLSPDEITRIDMQLKAANIEHKVGTDGKILISPERKIEALSSLSWANALPKNVSNGFDEMIKQLTAWDGKDRQDAIFNHGREVALSQVIAAYPGVTAASVFIDTKVRRTIGKDISPTATVNITTRENTGNPRQLGTAAATLVAGSHAGMTPSNVSVLVNQQPIPVRDPGSTSDVLPPETSIETQRSFETMLTDKVKEHLDYIPGVRVSVTVKVNSMSEINEIIEYNKATSLIEPKKTVNKTREEAGGTNIPLESGTVPNIGVSAAPVGGAPIRTNNLADESVDMEILPGMHKQNTRRAAGETTPVAASIRVPRSYFAKVAKGPDPAAKEPEQAAVEGVIAKELPNIQKAVVACTGIVQVGAITVEAFSDVISAAPPPQVAAASGMSVMLGGHIKEITLGGLAVASLFMMSMIVRKGAPVPLISTAPVAFSQGPVTLAGGEDVAGEASESSPTLDAMELDEESLRTQQVLAQVTNMVGDNPESAASLIKRWMNQR